MPIIKSLVDTSRDLREIGTSLHRVLSNVVGAVLLTSLDTVTMETNTSSNNTVKFAGTKVSSFRRYFVKWISYSFSVKDRVCELPSCYATELFPICMEQSNKIAWVSDVAR